MTKCSHTQPDFPSFDRRKIEASFEGGKLSSDGGVMLLSQADCRLGLLEAVNQCLRDPRDPSKILHSQLELLRQRVFGLALGYEDLNDHDTLRNDGAFQTALETDAPLASSPTLCRLEQRFNRKAAFAISRVIVQQFIASFKTPPQELVLDFDSTDDRVHGEQEGRAYHSYYGDWCFLPLHVFCGEQILVSYLRPSNKDGARHAWAILKLLVSALRDAWPEVRIVLRADSGFCRWKMLQWCEWASVDYIVGIARNSVLEERTKPQMEEAQSKFEATGQKQRIFGRLKYAAGTWDKSRDVIVKAEYTSKGRNPRYVVTNIEGDDRELYDKLYCARGEMENRIKEQQLGLFSDRTSCHAWWPNQFRLLLSALAYILVESIRRLTLVGTELAKAQVSTIRLKLFKVGTVVLRNTRRIKLLFSSAYPYSLLFTHVSWMLAT